MKPEIEILGISIKTFGVAFALGFICCGAVVARRLRELGKPADWAYEVIFSALVGGVVGARGYYLIQHYDQVKHDLIGNAFSGSGLVWYGGVVAVAMALLAYALWRLRDRVRPGVVFAVYLLGSGLERFLVEFIRRNHEVLGGLTAPQLESIGLCVLGAAWLAMLLRRGGIGALLPADA